MESMDIRRTSKSNLESIKSEEDKEKYVQELKKELSARLVSHAIGN